jgi:hypothetical protein
VPAMDGAYAAELEDLPPRPGELTPTV